MELEYEVTNILQKTPYVIDGNILDMIQYLFNDCEGGRAGVPLKHIERKLPYQGDWNDLTDMQKSANSSYKVLYTSAFGKRLALTFTLSVAELYRNEEKFYFPMSCDTRCRKYPISMYLNPQGDDLQKSLLRFKEGVPLGKHGFYWLCIHGSGLWGHDKVSPSERYQWVKDNKEWIIGCAKRPRECREWEDADKPLQFLQFCYEMLAIENHRGHLMTFTSSLCVGVDGTCNGLQHFAALLQDPELASKVNLIPSEQPTDVYKEVAQTTDKTVARVMFEGDDQEKRNAQFWSGKITRSTVKRATMTTPYGVTSHGS